MTTEHTPLPWDVSEQEWGDGPIYVVQFEHPDFTVSDIATAWTKDSHERPGMPLPAKANAEHIVRCVNAHDELVAALEMELEYHDGDARVFWNKYGDLTRADRIHIIKHALARARGEAS